MPEAAPELVPMGSPEQIRLPRVVDPPRSLTVQTFYARDEPSQWVARVLRGDEVLGEFGPLASAGGMQPVVGAGEALEILGIRGPNLNRVAGVADLQFQDLKMGRVWLRTDIERLAERRSEAGRARSAAKSNAS